MERTHQVIKLLSLYSITPHEITSIGRLTVLLRDSHGSTVKCFIRLDTQLYHEVDVAVLVAEILHEPLESAFLSAHLKNIK